MILDLRESKKSTPKIILISSHMLLITWCNRSVAKMLLVNFNIIYLNLYIIDFLSFKSVA